MSDPLEAIKRVLDAFERSDWTEIDVRTGDLRVHLSARGPVHAPIDRPVAPAPATADDPGRDTADAPSTAPAPEPPEGAHLVVAPSPGIFWRSPEPGAPHFADVGDVVDPSSTVCIIEVMKLMNHLKAGTAGEVAAVYADDGEAVEQGTPLFAIVPVGS